MVYAAARDPQAIIVTDSRVVPLQLDVTELASVARAAEFAERTPVGHNGTAGDVAHAICALIENDYITGVVLPCDGGLRLT